MTTKKQHAEVLASHLTGRRAVSEEELRAALDALDDVGGEKRLLSVLELLAKHPKLAGQSAPRSNVYRFPGRLRVTADAVTHDESEVIERAVVGWLDAVEEVSTVYLCHPENPDSQIGVAVIPGSPPRLQVVDVAEAGGAQIRIVDENGIVRMRAPADPDAPGTDLSSGEWVIVAEFADGAQTEMPISVD